MIILSQLHAGHTSNVLIYISLQMIILSQLQRIKFQHRIYSRESTQAYTTIFQQSLLHAGRSSTFSGSQVLHVVSNAGSGSVFNAGSSRNGWSHIQRSDQPISTHSSSLPELIWMSCLLDRFQLFNEYFPSSSILQAFFLQFSFLSPA